MPGVSRKRIWSSLLDKAWEGGVLITILTIVLGLALAEVQTKVGWLILVVALVVILACFAMILWAVVHYVSPILSGLADQVLDTLDKYISPDKINWLMTTPQMVAWEAKIKVPEIWCVSADLYEDMPDGSFFKVVDDNLRKHVKYIYFVSDTVEMRARVEQILRQHGNPQQMSVVYLGDEFFFLAPEFDFTIYNPLCEQGAPRVAYLGIPAEGAETHYHARISSGLTDRMVGKLMDFLNEKQRSDQRGKKSRTGIFGKIRTD